MKTVGILGGMSWESTALYCELVNGGVRRALGGHHSARMLLYCVDFAEVEPLQRRGDWAGVRDILVDAARRLQAGGADFVVIASNTAHIVYEEVAEAIAPPVLHIADCVAKRIRATGLTRVGLLGTAFTMERDFYRRRLEREHGLEVVVPDRVDRALIHSMIFEELTLGEARTSSRERLVEIVRALGVDGVILGCTELSLLIGDERDLDQVRFFDSSKIHAAAAVSFALGRTAVQDAHTSTRK